MKMFRCWSILLSSEALMRNQERASTNHKVESNITAPSWMVKPEKKEGNPHYDPAIHEKCWRSSRGTLPAG